MKILVVTRSLPMHKLGGMEAVAWDLITSFVAAGHEVSILTTPGPTGQTPPEISGIPAFYADCPSGQYSLRWWLGARKTYRQHKLDKVDVVLSVSAAGISLPLGAGARRPASFAQLHGTAVTEIRSKLKADSVLSKLKIIKNLVWMLLDFRYRIFDGFIAVGPAVLEDLRSYPTRLLLGAAPVFLINNGISAAAFSYDACGAERVLTALGIPATAKVGICASRLHEQKGVLESLRGFALAVTEDNNQHLIIAGDGPESVRLREEVRQLGLSAQIHFVGRVPREEIVAYFSAASYLLFTTLRIEVGATMSILEALAAGLPVIASASVLPPVVGGYPVDPADPQAISAAILAIDGTAARRSLLPENYSLEACTDGYIELFKKFAPSFRKAPAP